MPDLRHRRILKAALLPLSLVALAAVGTANAAVRGPDFNGDGFADLPIGIPLENISDKLDAGAIEVLYGTSGGLKSAGSQFITQNTSGVLDAVESGDQFGAAFAWGDFDGDGYDDLAIGAPQEDVGGLLNAGAVNVLYGSADGLTGTGSQFWTQNTVGVIDASEAGDQFGWSLAVGDFDADGFADLVIGVPGESVSGIPRAGAVNVLYGSASGLKAIENQFWNQDSSSILNQANQNDQFGSALAVGDFDHDGVDDLAIGVPGEGFELDTNVGAVNVLYGQAGFGLNNFADQFWTQDSFGVPDDPDRSDFFGSSLAVGDFDGDGIDDLAIGAPGEDVDGVFQDEGSVVVLYGRSTNGLGGSGAQFFTQNTSAVPGVPQVNDHFGLALAAGDFDNDGFDDLAVGAPGDSFGSVQQCGTVTVIYGQATGLSAFGCLLWAQSTSGVLDDSEGGDRFGQSLLAADFNHNGSADLAIGVPGESVGSVLGAGAVNVLYGSASLGLVASSDQLWTQNSSGIGDTAETTDNFGSSLGAGRVIIVP